MNKIIIKGLSQNNLKHISLSIPKHKITVFTGVSGSGKSSIVFDTIAAESKRQMNETYPAFIRSRLPQYMKPDVESIKNLTASVVVDQKPLGDNNRSTVGTITDIYSDLRLLFSRIGSPEVGTASYFSFNNPEGMCKECSGLGKVNSINIDALIDRHKSLQEGCVNDSTFAPNGWYWKQYRDSGLFDMNKPIKEYEEEEYQMLVYGNKEYKLSGIYNLYKHRFLTRDMNTLGKAMKDKAKRFITQVDCPNCQGKRLNRESLECKIQGYSIYDMCQMELSTLSSVLEGIEDVSVTPLLESLHNTLQRMIDIGLPYLHLNRETGSLSGGEAQRLKLVRYMSSSLSDMTYIFDEPSAGMHPHDVERMNHLLITLRDLGNTIIVVEHDKDVIKIADKVIDIGEQAGQNGGKIVFQGSYFELCQANTLTGRALRKKLSVNLTPRTPTGYLSIEHANTHNLKDVSLQIPLGILTTITGVAGSGKSTLISKVFSSLYQEDSIQINQSPIFATNRSSPVTYLNMFDEIRSLLALENKIDKSHFSFNSNGACPACQGKGVIVTELVYMDPVVNVCETCHGSRYHQNTLSYTYKGKNIVDILAMTIEEALSFFDGSKCQHKLSILKEVGLSYMTLGQPLSTLSGGELQRIKLAKHLHKKGKIYILDEPTTGLHPSDIKTLMNLFHTLVNRGNTVLIIEHNVDIMKQSDWIIDMGPEGGIHGGSIMFEGTPLAMIEHCKSLTAQHLRKA